MIDRIDHIVLTVKDISRTVDFYTTVLGMEEITFGENRKALGFGNQKINLHQANRKMPLTADTPGPGTADVCLIANTPLKTLEKHLYSCGVQIIDGPVKRSGAVGPIRSIYFRDPDANLIEVSNYIDPAE